MDITTPVRRLPFDLDKSPADRWTDIIEIYKDKIPRMKEEVNKIFMQLLLIIDEHFNHQKEDFLLF
jgi:beta subunit of N-acylethanolamine-hydrolyzing acid amidase